MAETVTGSATAGAGQPGGTQAGGAETAPTADTQPAVDQPSFNLGFGKGNEQAEKRFAGARDKMREKMRAELLAELGFDSPDAIEEHKKTQADAEKQRPEWERRARDSDKRAKDLETRATAAEKTAQDAMERAFGEYRQRIAGDVARAANLHNEAVEDLDAYMDRCCVTPEGGDGKIVFKDERHGVEIDMADPKALEKLAAHIAKAKPLWVRPTVSGGGMGIGGASAGRSPNGEQKPQTPQQSRDNFIRGTIASLPITRRDTQQ